MRKSVKFHKGDVVFYAKISNILHENLINVSEKSKFYKKRSLKKYKNKKLVRRKL